MMVTLFATVVDPNLADVHAKPDIFAGDAIMVVLTWATFFGLLFILQKFAFKPILSGLENREKGIRDSLEKAEQIKKEWAEVQESKNKILLEARQAALVIVEDSRKKAVETARVLEQKARDEAQGIIDAANQEIQAERRRVEMGLRTQSAEIAVALASKILRENLDAPKNQALVEQYLREFER